MIKTNKPRTRQRGERWLFFGAVDQRLTGTMLVLTVLGLILLSSVTAVIAYEQAGDTYALVKQQIVHGVIPGLVLFVFFVFFPHRYFQKIRPIMYSATLGLLLLSFVPGIGTIANNSQSWVTLFGITLQPSEFAKISFIMWASAWLTAYRDVEGSLRRVFFYSLYAGIVCFVLALQHDVGTMIIYGLLAGSLLVAAHAKFRHIALVAVMASIGIAGLILSAPHRLSRVTSFLNPTADIQGASYQLYQGLVAVGSGSWFGAGLGQSRQKFNYVPEIATDSIFAIIAEELGFIFTTALLLLFIYMFYRGFQLTRKSSNTFSKLLALGILLNIAYQLIINISSVVGLMPLTGVPLPLVSLGGSNMSMILMSIGMLNNATRVTSHGYV